MGAQDAGPPGFCPYVVADGAELVAVERVRCLDCGISYLKPCQAGIVQRNPGCPRCGYLGWISAFLPLSEATAPRRSGADRPLHQPHRGH